MSRGEFTGPEEAIKSALQREVTPAIEKLAAHKNEVADQVDAGVERLLGVESGDAFASGLASDVRIADGTVPRTVQGAGHARNWTGSPLPEGTERWPASGGMPPEREDDVLAVLKTLTKRPPDNVGLKPQDIPGLMDELRGNEKIGADAAAVIAGGKLRGARNLWEVVAQLQSQENAGSALMALRHGESLAAQGHQVAFELKNGKVYDIDVATLDHTGALTSAAQLKDMRGRPVTKENPAYPGYITEEIPNRLNKAIKQIFAAPAPDRQVLLDVHEPSSHLTQEVIDNMQMRANRTKVRIVARFANGLDLTVNPAGTP